MYVKVHIIYKYEIHYYQIKSSIFNVSSQYCLFQYFEKPISLLESQIIYIKLKAAWIPQIHASGFEYYFFYRSPPFMNPFFPNITKTFQHSLSAIKSPYVEASFEIWDRSMDSYRRSASKNLS